MKNIKYLIFLFICLCFFIVNLNAFSINSNSSAYVGSNVAVTIEANGLIGRFDITSSNENVLAGSYSKWLENEKVTLYFTAKNIGSSTITLKAIDVSDVNGNEFTGTRTVTINVINKSTKQSIDVNKTYNKNNYLKNLQVEGYEISFDKDTLEYSLELEPGTEKINISAKTEDDTASIKGIGEVSVSEGINTIEIVVTAENGNEKTYKIIATVEEKNPIEISLNNKKYRVIKKEDLLPQREGYNKTTVKINEFDVPALYNDVTKVYLVGLKDEKGSIKLYSYNTQNGEYSEYKELTFDLMNLFIQEKDNKKYKKIKIKINDLEVPAYKIEGIDDYYLLYATNTSTGYEGYYLYDTKENSVQRYATTLLENVTKQKDKYLNIVIVLSCVCFLCMLFLLVEVNKDNKRKTVD